MLTKEQGSENNLGATKVTNQAVKEKMELNPKRLYKNNNTKTRTTLSHGQQDNISTSSGRSSVTLDRYASSETDKENVDSTKSSEPLRKPSFKVQKAANPNGPPQISDLHTETSNPAEFSFEISFQKRKAQQVKDRHKENFELNEFLLLEQAAEDISFSSNSSFVQKLLDQNYLTDNGQRRLSSTPVKSAERHQERRFSSTRSSNGGKLNHKTEESGCSNSAGFDEQTQEKLNEMTKGLGDEFKHSSKDSEPATSEGDYASSGDEHNNSDLSGNEDLESEDSSREDDPKTAELKGPSKKLIKETKGRDLDLDLSDGEDPDNEERTLLVNDSKVSVKDDGSSTSSESEVGFDDERTWDDLGNVQSLKGVYESSFAQKKFIPSEYSSRSPTHSDKAVTRKIALKKGDTGKTGTPGTPDPPASELMLKLFPALKPKAKSEAQVSKPAPVHKGSGKFNCSNVVTVFIGVHLLCSRVLQRRKHNEEINTTKFYFYKCFITIIVKAAER